MHSLVTIQTRDFRSYAQNNGLQVLGEGNDGFVFDLPPVPIVSNGQRLVLPPVRLSNHPRTVVHLSEGIVRGQKLATIRGGDLLPSGYAHSFNWVEQNGFTRLPGTAQCRGDIRHEMVFDDDGARHYVLGLTSHFGHFFVDCLDRLLALEPIVEKNYRSRYVVDAEPIPQVRQIIELLGIDLPNKDLLILNPTVDYRISNLYIASLQSTKPAISLSTFVEFRRRVLSAIGDMCAPVSGIYVGRKSTARRQIINQYEIMETLGRMEITPFYPEDHHFVKTAQTFNSVNVVVIVLGSSKFNLALCRPGTKIVCLTPEGYAERPTGSVALMVRQLCALFELELCFCPCKVHGENVGFDSDLKIEKNSLYEALRILAIA